MKTFRVDYVRAGGAAPMRGNKLDATVRSGKAPAIVFKTPREPAGLASHPKVSPKDQIRTDNLHIPPRTSDCEVGRVHFSPSVHLYIKPHFPSL